MVSRSEWLQRLSGLPQTSIAMALAWFFTRRWALLAEGSPAILLGGMVLVAAWSGKYGATAQISHRYRSAYNTALDSGNLAQAELSGRKLVQLDPHDLDSRFALAWLADRYGDRARARRLMREVAPDETAGHPRAHFWLAQDALAATVLSPLRPGSGESSTQPSHPGQTDDAAPVPQVARAIILHHLVESLRVDRQREPAHELLAQLYLEEGDLKSALPHVEALVESRPDLRVLLADLHDSVGQSARARDERVLAIRYLERQVTENAADVRLRLLWAQAVMKNGQFDQAVTILNEGLAGEQRELVRQALAALYVAEHDKVQTSNPSDISRRVQLLQQALTYAPTDLDALSRLALFVYGAAEEAQVARASLKDSLAQGDAPAALHLALGTSAASVEKWGEAKLHLAQAYRLNPRSPAILNNLAWVLTSATPAQPELALRLIDAAVAIDPRHAEIQATRGQILVQLERWEEALTCLETALQQLGSRENLHTALALTYERLGDAELAARHQQLAKDTRSTPNP